MGAAAMTSVYYCYPEDIEATELSHALSDYLCDGKAWRNCREKVLAAYPVIKPQRRERFAAVMAGLQDYSAEELDGELIDLNETHISLGGDPKQGANNFLKNLRIQAKKMRSQSPN